MHAALLGRWSYEIAHERKFAPYAINIILLMVNKHTS